jgi:predicted Holliday junction resolvase-like endonuclease
MMSKYSDLQLPGTGSSLNWFREKNSSSTHWEKFRQLLVFILTIFILGEGYYIYRLQEKIRMRNDELKNISVQLQHLKQEREDLKFQLSARKTGEDDGNTIKR